jgi:serine/threonine protein kinase
MDNRQTKKIGKYELIAKVAQGGMGALYKAKHPTLGRVVLLKKLALRGGSQFVERFKREARIMMDFKNDHIVQVYDHFKEGLHYFIVEEYVDGISLDALIRKERYLTNEAAMLILYEVCKALKYAHDKQVIHRDIKPGNILISKEGEVKLVDFGIATSLEETDDGLTRDGMMLGTPAYVPPEQIDNAKNVDRRADIYSLGVVIYEMLTGKTPFPGSFTAETINLIHKGRYVPPQRLNRKIAPLMARIVRKCMRVRPKRRFQDLHEIIRLLEKRIKRKDPVSIKHAIRNVLADKDIRDIFKRRSSWPGRIIAAVVLLAALAAGGYYLYQQGAVFEYLAPDRYGALIISAQVASSYKDPGEIYFKPVLYRENGNDITRLDGIDFGLHENTAKRAGQSFVLETRRIYLEAGRYRLKVGLEGQLYWSSFTLSPRLVQRQLLATVDGMRIDLRQGSGAPQPLQVMESVSDAYTGEDLSYSADINLWINDRFVPGGLAGRDKLFSGATYRFVVSMQGYYPQTYNLIVKPYQTVVNLQASLVPHPGTLVLRSSTDGVSLQLNGSDFYSTGGMKPEYKKLEPLGVENRRLAVQPGQYTMTARRFASSRTLTFHVDPDASLEIDFSLDNGSLNAMVKP